MIGRNTTAGQKLTSFAERIERLLDDIDALKQDLKEVKAEAKGDGFNVPALVKLVGIRRNKKHADREAEMLNDLMIYAHATGTPLDLVMPGDEATNERLDPAAEGPAPMPSAAE